jgi:hypothetical protein
MATDPVTFFIRILLPITFQPQEDICLDNGKTKERLLTKMENWHLNSEKNELLISRYPLATRKKWSVGNEIYQKSIYLTEELKFVAI